MSDCTHDCSTCGKSDCGSRIEKEKANEHSNIKKIYAVVSGKGGVGKSMVTSMLSVATAKKGYKVGVLDADITGPSMAKEFGLEGQTVGCEYGILPMEPTSNIKVISINMLLEKPTEPVVWRGPVIAGAVKQFFTDVYWGDIDYMYIDMPPGTGDVPLTVFQSLPVDGIIVVTSPQDLVSMIVEKAVKMAKMMNIPIVGIVQNMSYFECPKCHEKHYIFGEGKVEKVAAEYDIKNVASLPIAEDLAKMSDTGNMALFSENYLDNLVEEITK